MYDWITLTLIRIQTMTDKLMIIINFFSWSVKSIKLIIFFRMFLIILHFELNYISSSRYSKYDAEMTDIYYLYCLNSSSVSWSLISFIIDRIVRKMLLIWLIQVCLKKLFKFIISFESDLFCFHVLKFLQ